MKKHHKILHVVNISFVLPYFIGDQFDHFRNMGFDIHVACSPSQHFSEYALEKQFHAVGINILREINLIEDIRSIYNLYKYIKFNKIDIVVGHTPKGGLIAMFAAFFSGTKKRVYFRHGIMFETSTGIKRFILKKIETLTARLATHIICVSPSVLAVSNKLGLGHPSKNLILGMGTCNGIDTKKFNKYQNIHDANELKNKLGINNETVIGYVGRLVNDKGIVKLIMAWKLLLARHKNIKLLLVGPLEVRDNLPEDIVNYIKEEPTIIYTGLVNNTVPYYQLMHIFILASYREGFPTVVLEASAMELPVITSMATGCIDSIINNITGMYTNIDPDSIAEKIGFYLEDPEIARQHGLNGRKFVSDNFQQEIIWDNIEGRLYK